MPSGKRKLELFDPNKSDSNDEDFAPGEDRPRRSPKKSRSQTKKSGAKSSKKRNKYRGSDISDDDGSDSLLDESFSEESEEEDVIMNEKTGRAVRKAAIKSVNYEEKSDDSELGLDETEDSEDDVRTKRSKSKRAKDEKEHDDELQVGSAPKRPRKMITLVTTPAKLARVTRAGSAAATRQRASVEPPPTQLPRRRTRAHTEEGDELVALSESGRHVIRSSKTPEPLPRGGRSTRGAKGLKQPSQIKEEIHESSPVPQDEQHDEQHDEAMIEATELEEDEELAAQNPELEGEEAAGAEASEPAEEDAHVGDADDDDDDDDDDDEGPVARTTRRSTRADITESIVEQAEENTESQTGNRRLTRGNKNRKTVEQSSDFEPEPQEESGDEEMSSDASPSKKNDDSESSPGRGRRSRRSAKSKSTSRRREPSEDEEELDPEELQEELEDLKSGSRRRRNRDSEILFMPKGRRERKPVDYSIKPLDQIYAADEDAEDAAPTPSRRARGGRGGASQPWERNLYTTFGPFGGAGGPAPVIGGPWGTGAAGNVDSDSSDEETMQRPSIGGNVGMTPTSAMPAGLLPGIGQTTNTDPITAITGTPANLGKVKSAKALADADPLGVDQNVDFSKVGGLEGHIDQLKEMVQMPLLYPELFMKFHVTPPRGVLFHGPPGTGKTLLARALAATVGTGGRKITFYMRKGADALSKWVGEAERQLRLLFEEARKTQPSIIFFDEIDGLAPVRSSKQEQIHASIVSTLLALMDGMDGRGQVIVIGATNRPDNIDPALRRPGRFDREFYFPLPDFAGRKSIINIHTRDWGIDEQFKDSLAHVTKGYGGADLRALCTEAALNAIQRTYPQIYSSNEKLVIDPEKIKITAKDFMLSVKKMIPSSERSTSSGASPLPKLIEPLLKDQLKSIERILDGLIPQKKKTTALQEAMYEQPDDDDYGFGRETLQQEFEKSRVFRPRLLICGEPGMGQAYIGGALLNHFEGLHVQNFDLPTIYSDSTRSPEAAIVQLFAEVKRHKPSVIYMPSIDTWYHSLSEAVITTFLGLLRSIPPTDPVLVLGITENPPDKVNPDLLRDLFGFSMKNRFVIQRPSKQNREDFFQNIATYVRKAPKDFPEPLNRKKRKLETLPIAPPPPPKPPTKEEIKAQKKRDHQLLNLLKVQIQPIMDQINRKYRKFRTPVIPQSQIQYLYDELDPNFVRPDVPQFRPFELDTDKDGVKGLRETASGKFFYNLETTTIEERLSNGFYARPKDFLADIRSLAKDAKHIGDKERTLKANELLANVEVDIATIEANPAFADCENVYRRQLQRAKEREEKLKRRAQAEAFDSVLQSDAPGNSNSEQASSGAIVLGETVPGQGPASLLRTPSKLSNGHSVGSHTHQTISNGTSVPSRTSGDDVQMSGTDDELRSQQASQFANKTQQTPQHWPRIPSQPKSASQYNSFQHTQISQRSAFQEISHDMSPMALINDASTTTSGKKTSDGWSTQATNGISILSSSSPGGGPGTDSQLPDTQRNSQHTQGETSSDEQWLHSQVHGLGRGNIQYNSQSPSSGSQGVSQPPVPTFPRASKSRPSGMANLLHDSPIESNPSDTSTQREFILDEFFVEDMLKRLTEGSSGCSIEQLEQINRELMDKLWQLRGEYNRTKVAAEMMSVFNEVIVDIEGMQRILQASQSQGESQLQMSQR
ncbi:hypothetical protein F5884DRAFT_696194 [Xylogone sp. PMI_703]|nr:hypothetical protein F5884DRAFT_696194 [Xylogone sp. PMI_703]